jgi:hypothetical protein
MAGRAAGQNALHYLMMTLFYAILIKTSGKNKNVLTPDLKR